MSNHRVCSWIREHLDVDIAPYPNRDQLVSMEEEVLTILDPPLNIRGPLLTPVRSRLKELRATLE